MHISGIAIQATANGITPLPFLLVDLNSGYIIGCISRVT